MDRVFSRLPGYGGSLEGLILIDCGRYSEARAFLRPRAFDPLGKPRFDGPYLHWYIITLINDGSPQAAEPLLEEAIRCNPSMREYKLSLVSCLLTQGKNPERARALIEEVLRDAAEKSYRENDVPNGDRIPEKYPSDAANRIARYAWALAACGMRSEAQTQIEKALRRLPKLKHWDVASLEYFLGEAWNAMGDFDSARQAFQRSIDLVPAGSMAIASRKALARIVAV